MKFDFLDIRGTLKIKGDSGFPNGAPAFNNGELEWIAAGVGGSTYAILGSTGYNYIIVSATGTPTENGQRLIDANQQATLNWSGSPAIDNRFTLLLTPGVFDFTSTSPDYLSPNNFVDIIGVSSNPHDTVIKGGGVLVYNNSQDSALENVYLSGENECRADGLNEYLRWKNVAVGGDTFNSLWNLVQGEFTDIKVENGSKFAYANYGINGIFKNIQVASVSSAFEIRDSGIIQGTFSNISISYVSPGNVFSSPTGSVYGKFTNIKIYHTKGGNVFSSNTDLSGDFRNIYIEKVENGNLFSSGTVSLKIDDMTVGDVSKSFFTASKLYGEYKNINAISVGHDFMRNISTASVDRLSVNKIGGDAFYNTTYGIDGYFRNINIGEIGGDIFRTNNLDINGTFSNIKIGPVTGDSFNSKTTMKIHINDYRIMASASGVFSSGLTLSIISHRGELENLSNFVLSSQDVNCELVDTRVNFDTNVSNTCVRATNRLSATISNFVSSDTKNAINADRIYGDFENMRFGNVTGNFIHSTNISVGGNIYFKNISAGNITGTAFGGVVDWGSTIKNVKLGNCGSAFIGKSLDCTLYDIEVGNVSKNFISGTYGTINGTITGDYRKIKVGDITEDAFRAWQNVGSLSGAIINGTFKDITIKSARNVFSTFKGSLLVFMNDARLENINIGTCATIFDARIKENVRVRNLNVDGGWTSQIYQGSLENSYINSQNKSFTVTLGTSSVISRSRVISPSGTPLSVSVGTQYLSAFNEVTGLSTPTGFTNSNYNIIDTDIS